MTIPKSRLLLIAVLALGIAGIGGSQQPTSTTQEFRYLRATAKDKSHECTFSLIHKDKGWTIRSVTGPDRHSLTVAAEYDGRDNLIAAEVTQATRARKKTARVAVEAGRAKITTADVKLQALEVPPGVIVTSAPDWTDVFLMCRRYDRKKGGRQAFPGLWIHPDKGAFRLTFTIERTGTDIVEHGGKKRELDRYAIQLRNKSEYTAWADAHGRMIRLRPGSKGMAAYELLLDEALVIPMR